MVRGATMKPLYRTCERCGVVYPRKYGEARAYFARRRFCSVECYRARDAEYTTEDRGHTTPCWISTYAPSSHGYCLMPGPDGRRQYAHRVMYERANGPAPAGMDLDHLCRVPVCCNPDHLEAVCHAENSRRGTHTKLDHEQAAQIRVAMGTLQEIADRFGVNNSTVHRIKRGEIWGDTRRPRVAGAPCPDCLAPTEGGHRYCGRCKKIRRAATYRRYREKNRPPKGYSENAHAHRYAEAQEANRRLG